MSEVNPPAPPGTNTSPPLPRVTIKFCTQCKWLLRAAYFAQELLSTFSTSLGEVALQPSTGGVFLVAIHSNSPIEPGSSEIVAQYRVLWDRKADGGFPETKELKRRVRDVIEPGRDLGHVDREHGKASFKKAEGETEEGKGDIMNQACNVKDKCEDCT
ncbi:hypothetical protein OQA88_324 [Cercophora sp. LCS_1]